MIFKANNVKVDILNVSNKYQMIENVYFHNSDKIYILKSTRIVIFHLNLPESSVFIIGKQKL